MYQLHQGSHPNSAYILCTCRFDLMFLFYRCQDFNEDNQDMASTHRGLARAHQDSTSNQSSFQSKVYLFFKLFYKN